MTVNFLKIKAKNTVEPVVRRGFLTLRFGKRTTFNEVLYLDRALQYLLLSPYHRHHFIVPSDSEKTT
jgi:hypothetical protein